jgi:hypothetical protein
MTSSPSQPERPVARRRFRRVVVAAILLLVGAAVVRVGVWRPLALVGSPVDDGFVRVSIHIHTTYSDGGGSPEEVVEAARQEGLGFVAITDHNNLEAKPIEGYRDGVLVLVGTEISNRQGHIVALGIGAPTYCFSADAQDALDDVRDMGGVPIVGHPLRAPSGDESGWSGWDLPGPWGMELINGRSLCDDAGWVRRLRTIAAYPANERYALLSLATSPRAELGRWDEQLAQRHVTGTLGADAHSRIPLSRTRAWRFPPYGPLLGMGLNHVLLERPLSGDAAADAKALLEAIARGRLYLAMDGLAPAGGFSFTAEAGGRRFTMGDTVPPQPAPTLRVAGLAPRGAQVRLLKDGRVLREGPLPLTVEAQGAGVYRTEVSAPGWDVPWVISNPIYVFGEESASARLSRAAWRQDPVPPPVSSALDGFGPETTFRAEFDPSSEMLTPAIDASGGIGGGPAAKIAFRLGEPTSTQPYTWCALVSRTPRSLADTKGLTFWIRADGVYRIWVQVRDENPRSADEGTEWWFASVRTSTEWRRVAVPYERLVTLNKDTDGRVDLDRVRGLVFVLDHKAVWPGTRGTIWIDELGLYR